MTAEVNCLFIQEPSLGGVPVGNPVYLRALIPLSNYHYLLGLPGAMILNIVYLLYSYKGSGRSTLDSPLGPVHRQSTIVMYNASPEEYKLVSSPPPPQPPRQAYPKQYPFLGNDNRREKRRQRCKNFRGLRCPQGTLGATNQDETVHTDIRDGAVV
ncbi:hypothetical protein F5Y11DRAFT_200758 [Daldinia sp. FL1419]|nr:hypothetical protein F5Y11DRAFT_200758 [Daldinia sp. FL1419]